MKIIKINACMACPSVFRFPQFPEKTRYSCKRKTVEPELKYSGVFIIRHREIKNPKEIPRWCPLNDYSIGRNHE